MAKLQLAFFERPLVGPAVTGASAREVAVTLASTLETTQRIRNSLSTYYTAMRDQVRQLERKLSAANAYVQAANTYLGRATRHAPAQAFQPPQSLPDVFRAEPFIMADFSRLTYQHMEAVAAKYDKTVSSLSTQLFKPRDTCHRSPPSRTRSSLRTPIPNRIGHSCPRQTVVPAV